MTLFDLATKYDSVKCRTKYPYSWDFVKTIYPRYFDAKRETSTAILEVGCWKGGFLRALKEYFPNADIYGIDITPPKISEKRITTIYGDQDNREQLERIARNLPLFDFIIEDGGHKIQQQINTFEVFFPKLISGGYYFIEDVIGGDSKGFKIFNHIKDKYLKEDVFVNLAPGAPVRRDKLSKIKSITFYFGMIAIEKE